MRDRLLAMPMCTREKDEMYERFGPKMVARRGGIEYDWCDTVIRYGDG